MMMIGAHHKREPQKMTDSVAEIMKKKLEAAFAPAELEIIDDSHRHAGHAGARPEGESHFTIHMTSARFQGLSRVARHQAVHKVLATELAGPVHALSLKLSDG